MKTFYFLFFTICLLLNFACQNAQKPLEEIEQEVKETIELDTILASFEPIDTTEMIPEEEAPIIQYYDSIELSLIDMYHYELEDYGSDSSFILLDTIPYYGIYKTTIDTTIFDLAHSDFEIKSMVGRDTIIYEFPNNWDSIPKTKMRTFLTSKTTPIYLISGIPLQAREITQAKQLNTLPSYYLNDTLILGDSIVYELEGQKYLLYIKGTVTYHEEDSLGLSYPPYLQNYELIFSDGQQAQTIFSRDVLSIYDSYWLELKFQGDIDRDGKLDLIIGFSGGGGRTHHLYLSSQAKSNDLLKMVSSFSSSCC